ncbi:MAG: phosphotransferase [Spirochaetaceae bacterium]|nr:MAG: phosphotransferase [Spirochaetaceae bacterium]
MNNLPFDKPGAFYRGNLHTHSTRSDGAFSAVDVCGRYRAGGYDFVSITDHAMERYGFPITDTRSCRGDGFTTIIGAELHAGTSELGNLWHIVANGLPLDFDPRGIATGQEVARKARDAGAFVTVAHPAWYTLSEADIASFTGVAHAIEVGNGVAGAMQDRYDSWYIADLAFHRGHRFFITAADDFHGQPHRREFELGWVWVKAAENESDSLVAALKAGHYYSSSGPRIHHVAVTPGKVVHVACDPADLIVVTGTGAQAAYTTAPGTTEADLDIRRFDSTYLRVTVRDAAGRRAWTNPIWV